MIMINELIEMYPDTEMHMHGTGKIIWRWLENEDESLEVWATMGD